MIGAASSEQRAEP